MLKTFFCLSAVVAALGSPSVNCAMDQISLLDEDKLSIPNAPQDEYACYEGCKTQYVQDETDWLSTGDMFAGCSFDVFEYYDASSYYSGCDTSPNPNNAQFELNSQQWSFMTQVILYIMGLVDTVQSINIGLAGNECDPIDPTLIKCEDNACDITSWIKSKSGAITIVVQDQSNPESPINLSQSSCRTYSDTRMFGAANSCTSIKTGESDCVNAGCKYCNDPAPTQEGYQGCGVSPSVCTNDGTLSTSTSTATTEDLGTTTTRQTPSSAGSLMSVSVASLATAIIFMF